ncbi:MAG: diacylglycerol kinase family lipid kinase, partial [Clostridia bacterium]|nr:diacylglycerol kinase family lipid kinase [Clostridia bacterium]
MKRATLIINPVAGKMQVKGAFFEIVSKLCEAGYDLKVKMTRGKGDAIEIAASQRPSECDVVLCAGGDGTL